MLNILLNNVLKNVWIWGMAITYFFIYVIRQGVTSWSIFFLMNVKGVPDAGTAGALRCDCVCRAAPVAKLLAACVAHKMVGLCTST